MSRPRVIPESYRASIYFDKNLYNEIQRLAREKGMSVSEYVRMIVIQYLKENSQIRDQVSPTSQGSSSGSRLRDPVLDRELRDFANMIDDLEGEVSMCEYKLDQLQQSVMDLRRGFKVYLNYYELHNIGDWIKRLNDKWYKYKRWYYSLKNKAGLEDVAQLGERFVKVKDEIDKMYKTYKEISKIIETNSNKIAYKVV
jgi:predicted nuclease with TOPRIM domain